MYVNRHFHGPRVWGGMAACCRVARLLFAVLGTIEDENRQGFEVPVGGREWPGALTRAFAIIRSAWQAARTSALRRVVITQVRDHGRPFAGHGWPFILA
jgi:hypothetical protein